MSSLKILFTGNAFDKYGKPSWLIELEHGALLMASSHLDCLETSERAGLQAAYVGRLDQWEAEEETGPVR